MSVGTLLFRADASVAIGTGHAMRCLALAQAWQDTGGRAVFAIADSTPAIRRRITAESYELADISGQAGTVEDVLQTIELARNTGCEWIAVDGYHFGEDYQRALKERGLKVLLLDDYGHAERYFADVVLNQNISARESLYRSRSPETRLLLGPRYCLLRREFSAWRNWKREVRSIGRRVLVMMGGSDPENVTARAMDALTRVGVEDLEAKVVIGGSNPHAEMLEQLAAVSGKRISVCRDVANIPELMAWADIAVSSAGTTCWELCLMAVPSLLVDVAENQTALAAEMGQRGCAIHLGAPDVLLAGQVADQVKKLLESEIRRRDLSTRCRQLVDGRGAQRLVSVISGKLRLRAAEAGDCRLLWEWANDPQVRAAAFSSAPIPWESHQAWFIGKMNDPHCSILIAEDDLGRQVGQFRVDWRSDCEGDISLSVATGFRGTGRGAALIDLGVGRIFADKGESLHAFVKVENQASRRAFEQAGFASLGEECVKGHHAIHYVRRNELGIGK